MEPDRSKALRAPAPKFGQGISKTRCVIWENAETSIVQPPVTEVASRANCLTGDVPLIHRCIHWK